MGEQGVIISSGPTLHPPPPLQHRWPPPPPLMKEGGALGAYSTMGLVSLLVAGLYYAQHKGYIQLPFDLPFMPRAPKGAVPLRNGSAVPRPRAKSLTVHVTRADESDAHELSILTKGLKTVADLGEAVAEQLAKELYIEEPFKMYYVDDDSDDLLVNAHTTLKELLGSECVTARLEAQAKLPPPRAARAPKEKRGKHKPSAVVPLARRDKIDDDFD